MMMMITMIHGVEAQDMISRFALIIMSHDYSLLAAVLELNSNSKLGQQ